jgi:putative serine protease PepD
MLVGAVAFGLAVVIAVPLVLLWSQVADVRSDIAAMNGRLLEQADGVRSSRHALTGLGDRVSSLEAAAESQKDPSEIARTALRSVATIVSGQLPNQDLGSGFAIRSKRSFSLLVTNYHVVRNTWEVGGRTVAVKQDDKTFTGTIEAVNRDYDLALIRLRVRIPALSTDARPPKPGESVLVIGSPYGLEGSVTSGIVSNEREGYLQFSAPVSPGSSGGPVVDADGNVVGVVVSKIVAAGAEGLSFAVPIGDVCKRLVGC